MLGLFTTPSPKWEILGSQRTSLPSLPFWRMFLRTPPWYSLITGFWESRPSLPLQCSISCPGESPFLEGPRQQQWLCSLWHMHRWPWALALCLCMFQLLWLPHTSQAPWLCSVVPFGSWMNSEESQNNSENHFLGLELPWEFISKHKDLRERPWHGFQIGQVSQDCFEMGTGSRMSLRCAYIRGSL